MLPDFDLQQLRMFWTLGRTRSFTQTAIRLFRTQSAVSHAIRKLESSAEAKLVWRRGRNIELTEEGRVLFDACEDAFGAIESAAESIAVRQGKTIGKLRLGSTVEFGCSILMKHMQPFMVEHPEIDMHFRMSHELITPLLDDDLDVIIDCREHNYPILRRTTLFREKYVVACSPEYQDLLRISSVEDLRRCAILSMDPDAAWWHHFIFSIPEAQRPGFGKIITINHVRGIISAAKSGMGVAFVPQYSILNEIARGELSVLFPELELLEDRFAIYQKIKKAKLLRHIVLTDYLKSLKPSEFGI